MNKKINGAFVCMLMLATTLPFVEATNIQTTRNININNYSEIYLGTPVNSGIITIKINAKVYEVSDLHNLLGGAIKVNDTIIGEYTYDSGIPDSNPSLEIGQYNFISSSCGIDLMIGEFVFKTNPSDVHFSIKIYDYYYVILDGYNVLSEKNLQLSNGMLVAGIQWSLWDDLNGSAVSGDALPTTAPNLSDWNYNFFHIWGNDSSNPNNGYDIYAHVTKATKSKARDVYFTGQPVLIWLLEQFQKIFPLLRQLTWIH